MQNIEDHVLAELKPKNRRSAWNIFLTLKNKEELSHLQKQLTRLDVSQNLQKLKRRGLVKNDGAVWWSTCFE